MVKEDEKVVHAKDPLNESQQLVVQVWCWPRNAVDSLLVARLLFPQPFDAWRRDKKQIKTLSQTITGKRREEKDK